jgi:hypothetical protein
VNVEDEYHEEIRNPVPGLAETEDQEYAKEVAQAFARYDAVALGVAVGSVAGLVLFLSTLVLLLRGGRVLGPMLSLLGNYLVGYQVSWAGAALGLAEGFVGGFLFGYLVARAINAVTHMEEMAFRRRAEMAQILEPS